MSRLFIFGAHSTALEMAETARTLSPGVEVIHVIGEEEEAPPLAGVVRLQNLAAAADGGGAFLLSMADTGLRAQCLEAARTCGLQPRSLIHPRAWVAPSAVIGEGTYLAPGACLSTGVRLGSHCLVNLNATVGHDVVSGDHLMVNPGAAISGGVLLGHRVLVGANAFIYQQLTIGDDCRIDALAYVARSLEPGSLCTSRHLKVYPGKAPPP